MDGDCSTWDSVDEHLRVIDEFLSCHLGTVRTDGWFTLNAAGAPVMDTSHFNSDTTLSHSITIPEVINDAVVQVGTIEPSKILPIQDNCIATELSSARSNSQRLSSTLPSTEESQSQQQIYHCSPLLPVREPTNECKFGQNMNSFPPQCQFSRTMQQWQASIIQPITNNITMSHQYPTEPPSISEGSPCGTFIRDLMTTLPRPMSAVQNKSMCTIASNDRLLHNTGISYKLVPETSLVLEAQANSLQASISAGQRSTSLVEESINRTFVRQNISEEHYILDDGEKLFHCDICGTRFTCLWSLKRHFCVRIDEKPFTCTKCHWKFLYESSLKMHYQSYHPGEKIFSCTLCPEKFSNKLRLNEHCRSHNNEYPFVCSKCHKKFLYEYTLKAHCRLTHPSKKPFSCDICAEKFSRKYDLNRHYRIHTGEKPFRCYICQKQFSCKANLTGHYCIHTGERPFKCERCPSKFSYKSNLKIHYRIHTGERPFKCDKCLKKFSQKCSLNRHYCTQTV